MEKNLTTGSVLKNILFFSLPYLFSYFLQTLYGMADLFIIGQFEGVAATTAVSIGSQVMHMLTVMIVGLAMGTTVSIAQAIGANKKDDAAAATGNTVTLFLILSVCLTGALLCVIRPITMIMSVPEEAVSGTIAYLTICFIGIPFITAYNIISSIFRGMGDSKSPMYFIAVACVANIILDYIFIGLCKGRKAGYENINWFKENIKPTVLESIKINVTKKIPQNFALRDFFIIISSCSSTYFALFNRLITE